MAPALWAPSSDCTIPGVGGPGTRVQSAAKPLERRRVTMSTSERTAERVPRGGAIEPRAP